MLTLYRYPSNSATGPGRVVGMGPGGKITVFPRSDVMFCQIVQLITIHSNIQQQAQVGWLRRGFGHQNIKRSMEVTRNEYSSAEVP